MAHKERETINSFYSVLLDYGQLAQPRLQLDSQLTEFAQPAIPFDLINSINSWPTCNCIALAVASLALSFSDI